MRTHPYNIQVLQRLIDAPSELLSKPSGRRAAGNLIRDLACQLAERHATDDLANAASAVQAQLIRAWENRWLKDTATTATTA